ncbi:M28 family peptidase [Herpetosiphon sp. NSE202]|uniref:M28 family peptidase n=1 Tax=Herpetosiphon sp. NSE202 TaxID=3351349 RepID=UPI0036404620
MMRSPQPARARFWLALALLGILGIGGWIGWLAIKLPTPLRNPTTPNEFSVANAYHHVAEIAAEPHPIGSIAQFKVRDYLISEIKQLGLQPEIQKATAIQQDSPAFMLAGSVENVVVRVAGSDTHQTIMLVAHYDSVATGPGANDDGVAVAAMLETLRALLVGPPPKNDLIFLFTDGEEAGLLGASAFMRDHAWAKDVDLVLNFEARGSRGVMLMFETSMGNQPLVSHLAAIPQPVASSLFADIYKQLPNDTDFTIFREAGLAGLNFAYIDGLVHYHASTDTVANVDRATLQHYGRSMLALTQQLAASPHIDLDSPRDAIFFNVGRLAFVRYPSTWAWPLTLLTLGVTLGMLVVGLRAKRLTWYGIVRGFWGMALATLLAVGCVQGIWYGVTLLVDTYRHFTDVYNSGIYFLSFGIVTIAIVGFVYQWLARRTDAVNLLAGSLGWWMLLMLASTILLPGGSYLFTWPLLIVSGGLWFYVRRSTLHKHSSFDNVWLTLSTVPGLILLTPIIGLIFIALTLVAPFVGVSLIVLLTGLFVPGLLALGNVLPRFSFGVLGVIGIGIAFVGGLTAKFDPAHPIPTSLAYGLDYDTQRAWWLSSDQVPADWTETLLSAQPESALNTDFYPYSQRGILRNPGPSLALAAPTADIIDDRTTASMRLIRLRIRSPRQAQMIAVYLGQPTTVLTASLNQQPVDLHDRAALDDDGRWALEYWGAGSEGFELSLGIAPTQSLPLILIDHAYHLPQEETVTVPEPYTTNPYGLGIPHMTFVRISRRF